MTDNGALIRAGRALLAMSRDELSRSSGLAKITIHRAENNDPLVAQAAFDKMRAALEDAGVEFLKGGGLRLRR